MSGTTHKDEWVAKRIDRARSSEHDECYTYVRALQAIVAHWGWPSEGNETDELYLAWGEHFDTVEEATAAFGNSRLARLEHPVAPGALASWCAK